MIILRETQALTERYRESLRTEIEERTGKECLIIPKGLELAVVINGKRYNKLQELALKALGYRGITTVVKEVVAGNPVEGVISRDDSVISTIYSLQGMKVSIDNKEIGTAKGITYSKEWEGVRQAKTVDVDKSVKDLAKAGGTEPQGRIDTWNPSNRCWWGKR